MAISEGETITAGPTTDSQTRKQGVVAAGGMLGAIAASSCCILPLVLFSLGASGAWIGQLTSLAPYQPIFVAVTVGFLGYGYWLVYRKPKVACAGQADCAKPAPNRVVKSALWTATALVITAFSFNYWAPYILA